MPVSPVDAEGMARNLLDVYTRAEVEIMRIIARALVRGLDAPQWAANKLVEISTIKRKLEKVVEMITKEVGVEVAKAVEEAYMLGQRKADHDLRAIGFDMIKTGLSRIDRRKVAVLAETLRGTLEGTHLRIVRQSLDEYRTIIGKTVEMMEVGVLTRQQATQAGLNRFADRGISGFQDRSGRNWTLTSYAEMATRTTYGQSALEGTMQRLRDNDLDLVVISSHSGSCPLCEPWEGEVLSMGGSKDHPSLDTAISEGLFHPNCGHSLGAYVEGLTTIEKVAHDPQEYENRQKQRKMERDIRFWKKREAVAISEDEGLKARIKVREKQANMRAFIEDTGLTRQRHREQI